VLFKKRPLRSFFQKDKTISNYIRNVFGCYPGNIFLYKLAFKHKSSAKEKTHGNKVCNERLEYLGDAILDAIVAEYLFKKFPFENEGFLTETKSKIVSRSSLNMLSKKLGLDKMLESDPGVKITQRSIGGDALESFIGAMYLDKGYKFTKKTVLKYIIKTHINVDELVQTETNYKSRLIEWAQKEKKDLDYIVTDIISQKQKKLFEVAVVIDGETYEKAQHYSIKGAEQLASEKSCKLLFEND
jgi:ribonuclease-3